MPTPKEIAAEFLRKIIRGEIRGAYEEHTAPGFRHHNAYFKGDAESLIRGMEDNHQHFPEKTLQTRNQIAEGDLVAMHSLLRFTPDHAGIAVVHLFRFEAGKIAELWDVAQVLPDASPNENGPL